MNASYQDIFGQTALHCAAINGNLEMVDPKDNKNNNRTNRGENKVDFFGQTALQCAAINGNLKWNRLKKKTVAQSLTRHMRR